MAGDIKKIKKIEERYQEYLKRMKMYEEVSKSSEKILSMLEDSSFSEILGIPKVTDNNDEFEVLNSNIREEERKFKERINEIVEFLKQFNLPNYIVLERLLDESDKFHTEIVKHFDDFELLNVNQKINISNEIDLTSLFKEVENIEETIDKHGTEKEKENWKKVFLVTQFLFSIYLGWTLSDTPFKESHMGKFIDKSKDQVIGIYSKLEDSKSDEKSEKDKSKEESNNNGEK